MKALLRRLSAIAGLFLLALAILAFNMDEPNSTSTAPTRVSKYPEAGASGALPTDLFAPLRQSSRAQAKPAPVEPLDVRYAIQIQEMQSFGFGGSLRLEDGRIKVFLTKGGSMLDVLEGDVLEGQFKADEVTAQHVKLVLIENQEVMTRVENRP